MSIKNQLENLRWKASAKYRSAANSCSRVLKARSADKRASAIQLILSHGDLFPVAEYLCRNGDSNFRELLDALNEDLDSAPVVHLAGTLLAKVMADPEYGNTIEKLIADGTVRSPLVSTTLIAFSPLLVNRHTLGTFSRLAKYIDARCITEGIAKTCLILAADGLHSPPTQEHHPRLPSFGHWGYSLAPWVNVQRISALIQISTLSSHGTHLSPTLARLAPLHPVLAADALLASRYFDPQGPMPEANKLGKLLALAENWRELFRDMIVHDDMYLPQALFDENRTLTEKALLAPFDELKRRLALTVTNLDMDFYLSNVGPWERLRICWTVIEYLAHDRSTLALARALATNADPLLRAAAMRAFKYADPKWIAELRVIDALRANAPKESDREVWNANFALHRWKSMGLTNADFAFFDPISRSRK